MSEPETQPTNASVETELTSRASPAQRADGQLRLVMCERCGTSDNQQRNEAQP